MFVEEWVFKVVVLGYVEVMYWLGEGYVFYVKEFCEEDLSEVEIYFGYVYYWLKQVVELKYFIVILELVGFYCWGDVVEKDVVKLIELV